MSIKRHPAHPGRILKNMYIEPLSLTITYVADMLNVSRKAVSAIVNERKAITPEMALRLSKAFDTTPEFWMNLQNNYDLWRAERDTDSRKEVEQIYSAPSFA